MAPGWSTSDVYNAYLLASAKENDAMAYLVIADNLDDGTLEKLAKDAAYPSFTKDLEWSGAWSDAKAGKDAYPARVRKCQGTSIRDGKQKRACVAVGIQATARKPVFVYGTWNDPGPDAERDFVELLRGAGRCAFKPNRGCVPVAGAGEEKELENPPKQAPAEGPY